MCVKKRKKQTFCYSLSSSYGARIRGCSNPAHETQCFPLRDRAHCVHVCDVQACSETWGWAGSLLSLQTDWWRLLDAVERPPTGWVTVSHTDAVWDFFHKLPRINLVVRRKWALVLENFALNMSRLFPELLFGKWKWGDDDDMSWALLFFIIAYAHFFIVLPKFCLIYPDTLLPSLNCVHEHVDVT